MGGVGQDRRRGNRSGGMGVVLATCRPLPASSCRGALQRRGTHQRPRFFFFFSLHQRLNGGISRGSAPAIYSPGDGEEERGRGACACIIRSVQTVGGLFIYTATVTSLITFFFPCNWHTIDFASPPPHPQSSPLD